LEFGYGKVCGVHLLHLVGLAGNGHFQVLRRFPDHPELAVVVGGMDLLGISDGPEEASEVGFPFLFRDLGEDEVAHVGLGLSSKRRLKVFLRHLPH
jgi:hypothetical protein